MTENNDKLIIKNIKIENKYNVQEIERPKLHQVLVGNVLPPPTTPILQFNLDLSPSLLDF